MSGQKDRLRRRGAYGLVVAGVPGATALLVDAPPHWPEIEVTASRLMDNAPPPDERVDTGAALVHLRSGGWVKLERASRSAEFLLADAPSTAALVHPHLAAVAAVQAHWTGQDSFHAGGFVINGGVWALLGDKGAGKSTTLASLARSGVQVMCDDILVLRDLTAMAGPRAIDLRAEAARRLETGSVVPAVIGGRERWRLRVGAVEAELPMRGWINLRWAPDLDVRPVHGTQRLRRLMPHRALRVRPVRPEHLINLAALPMLELSRPRQWHSHERAIALLQRAVGEIGDPG